MLCDGCPALCASCNDKCAVKYDQFVMDIHEGLLFSDVEWSYYDEKGVAQTEKGCWLLCDGGYHKWGACCLLLVARCSLLVARCSLLVARA